MKQIEGAAARGHGEERHHRRGGRSHRAVDHVVCALRLSRVARGQLRAARLCERVFQGALPGGVLHGAAQQPADGVLSSGHAGEGRAAARRALRSRSTCRCRTGTARSRPTARSAWACATCAGCARRSGRSIAKREVTKPPKRRRPSGTAARCCPKCGCDDPSMIESVRSLKPASPQACFCNVCSHEWTVRADASPAALPLDRRSDPPHRAAPRRGGRARRDRRAQLARPRSPLGAVAGRARGPPGRRALRRARGGPVEAPQALEARVKPAA